MVLSANGRPSDSQSENKGSIPLRTEYVKRNKIIVWCYHLVGRSVEGSIPLWARNSKARVPALQAGSWDGRIPRVH